MDNYLLPFEIWQLIFDYSDFADQLKLKQLSILFSHLRLKILPKKCSDYLTNTKLNTIYFRYLQELDINYSCHITNEGIKKLNLRKLNVCGHGGITNVNHMTKLQELD
jgi:hypothetical protein